MKFAFVLILTATVFISACNDESVSSSTGGDRLTGTGGSTARMTIAGDYLYAISGSSVQLFDIANPATPLPWTQVQIDWDIQTLFPYEDYLLVGAADGMHILDNTDPASPQYVGDFQHARTIDPVVAQNDIAYITLKVDTSQPDTGITNQMNVVDISDVTQPVLLNTIPMQGPAGLSVSGNRLYVCDGIAGLKTFDISNATQPVAQGAVPGVDCSDVIAANSLLYVIDNDGLTQYDTTTDTPLSISRIETEPVVYSVGR